MFDAYWFRNDDLIISILVKGIIITDKPIFHVYHMNTLLTFLISKLENIFPADIYTYFMYLIIIISGTIITLTFNKKINNKVVSQFLVLIIITPMILRPTFSSVAGLFLVAGISLLDQNNDFGRYWIVAILIIFAASLIRDEVIYLGLLIYLLSLVVEKYDFSRIKNKIIRIFPLLVILLISYLWNGNLYSEKKYEYGQQFEKYISIPIYDYGADKKILQNQEIFSKYNLTENDIKLLRNYFNTDLEISNPIKVKSILGDIGWSNIINISNERFIEQIKSIYDPISVYLLSFIFLTLILLIIKPKSGIKIFLLSTIVCIIFAIIGRLEIYIVYNFFILYLVLNILNSHYEYKMKNNHFILMEIIIISSIFFYHYIKLPNFNKFKSEYLSINENKIWNWGGALPIQQIFPINSNPKNFKNFQVYDMGWSSFIPGTFAYQQILEKTNFIPQLLSKEGLNIFANGFHLPLIDNYCKENFGGITTIEKNEKLQFINLYKITCTGSVPSLSGKLLEFDTKKSFIWITKDNMSFSLKNGSDSYLEKEVELKLEKPPCMDLGSKFEFQDSKLNTFNASFPGKISLFLKLQPKETETFTLLNYDSKYCKVDGDNRLLISKLSLNSD